MSRARSAHSKAAGSALVRAAALAPAAALVLAGCGYSSPTGNGLAADRPAQIVAAARGALRSAATVHVSGSIQSAGRPISLDMELLVGKGGRGQLDIDGLSLQLVRIEHELYLRGDDALYSRIAGAQGQSALRGRWLKLPLKQGNDFAPLAQLTSIGPLLELALADHGPLRLARGARIQGHSAVAVTDESGGGTLYVAAVGTPYPLEIVAGDGRGSLVFDRWDEPVSLTVPPDWINIDSLSGQ